MRNVLFAAALLTFCVTPLFAWHTNTHLQMTRDAIALMPEEFQKVFKEHLKLTEAGIKDPDDLIKDWQNHYYIPTNPPEGGALDHIDKLIKTVQIKMKSGNYNEMSKQFCYLAHYIGDLWEPESLIKKSTIPDMSFVENNDLFIVFDGYDKPIENFHDYFQKRSQWRWRLENTPQVSTLLYNEAVNDIAKTWLTLWQESGKTVAKIGPKMIEHNKEAMNVNFERLLTEEQRTFDTYGEPNIMDAYEARKKEIERLQQNVDPSTEAMIAKAELRKEQEQLSKLNPKAPFRMVESSIRTIGDQAYFVARVRNKSEVEIPSIAFMYPGVKGPAALVMGLKPGQVAKIEAVLPANATKEQIQLIFSTPNEQ
jgi:hypothetical protein